MHRSPFFSVSWVGLWALLSILASACASTGNLVTGTAAQMRFFEYRGGLTMTVVNESHTDRVELYSEERDNASTKVAPDEVMDALIDRVKEFNFAKFAKDGPAPKTSTLWSQAIEVETAKGTMHMLVGPELSDEAKSSFRRSREAFLQIYNNVYGAQTVKGGERMIQDPNRGQQD